MGKTSSFLGQIVSFKSCRVSFLSKVDHLLRHESNNDWPYGKLEHWPPMTYRSLSGSTSEAIAAFTGFLKTENEAKQTMELQPWIPFCEGRCTFCYFPVNCEKQNVSLYIKALKKALAFYAKSRYVTSSIFNEFYVGGGSPTVLAKNQIAGSFYKNS